MIISILKQHVLFNIDLLENLMVKNNNAIVYLDEINIVRTSSIIFLIYILFKIYSKHLEIVIII